MLTKFTLPVFIFCIMITVSCDDQSTPEKNVLEPYGQNVTDSARALSQIEPALLAADSLQILYYDDPDGDSLRYSRYFRYTIATDTVVINALKEDFKQQSEMQNALRNCRAEGKIYLYGKGKELKTVYFSGKPGACGFLYIIRNGNFYYVSLGKSFKNILQQQREMSVNP